MKEFAYFLTTKKVLKRQPDRHLAKATAKDSIDRLELAKNMLITQKPKYALENAYEAVHEMIDAILYEKGFKSYSHEASVSYLIVLGFPLSEVTQIGELRKHRNGIKYYGEDATIEEAKAAVKIAKETIQQLRSMLTCRS